MTHKRSFLTVENSLYLALFVLALALRLHQLNAHPLTDAEAREALPIYRLIRGQAGTLLPHSPAYFFFTYFAFLILGASDATARLAPALFGAGLVFVPALFGDRLGRAGALLTSGLLAVSASLLAASRSAEGSVIALFGLSFGLGALRQFLRTSATPWLIASAIALGVGLASGAAFLTGAFVFALTALVVTWINPEDRDLLRGAWARPQAATFFITLGLTVILVATVGLLYLRGLGALVDSWAAWLGGFVPNAGSRTPLTLPFFLIVYEPLVVVFGLIGAARAVRASTADRFAQSLSWLSLMALVFLLLYSGRAMPDAIWLTLPLTALAAWALVELVRSAWASEEWAMAAAQLGVVGALLGFAALNVAAFAEQTRINPQVQQGQTNTVNWFSPASPYTSLTMAGVALVLTVVISYLFSMGWSPRSARLGLTLGVTSALLLVGLGASWGLTQLRANNPAELWWAAPASATADDVNRLMETLGNVSNFSVGNAHDVAVTVQASPDGALGWTLRDFPHARFVQALDPQIADPVVIAPEIEQNPTLGSSYVGQGFALRRTASYDLSWPEWIGWLAFRRTPVQAERVILWVRQDVQQLQGTGR